ncbi:MAG TPA: phosphate propanoyltransferase [Candidatus Pacearchaeota archaeon]|jgi:propanediol utilization protein|nr:phosphate propanoyltransferase [Candidatus Pacearchaeota archaeon]
MKFKKIKPSIKVPVEISARHIHLSKEDFEKLFGKNKKLESVKKLSQPGEFASKNKIKIINGKEKLNARILGPLREYSQAEISLTDAYTLKLNPLPKVRLSGDIYETTNVTIKGPKSQIKIPAIIAQRHLHCSEEQAKKIKLKDHQIVSVKIDGQRKITFHNVIVRISKKYNLSVHLDTDEANAAGISEKTFGEIIK